MKLSTCDGDHMACEAENAYHEILYWNMYWPWSRIIRCQKILPKFLPMTPGNEALALGVHSSPEPTSFTFYTKKLISLLLGLLLQNTDKAQPLHTAGWILAVPPSGFPLCIHHRNLQWDFTSPTDPFHLCCRLSRGQAVPVITTLPFIQIPILSSIIW